MFFQRSRRPIIHSGFPQHKVARPVRLHERDNEFRPQSQTGRPLFKIVAEAEYVQYINMALSNAARLEEIGFEVDQHRQASSTMWGMAHHGRHENMAASAVVWNLDAPAPCGYPAGLFLMLNLARMKTLLSGLPGMLQPLCVKQASDGSFVSVYEGFKCTLAEALSSKELSTEHLLSTTEVTQRGSQVMQQLLNIIDSLFKGKLLHVEIDLKSLVVMPSPHIGQDIRLMPSPLVGWAAAALFLGGQDAMTGEKALAGLEPESLRHYLTAMISRDPEQRLSLEGCHAHFFTWRKDYKQQGQLLNSLGNIMRNAIGSPKSASPEDMQFATRLATKLDALGRSTMLATASTMPLMYWNPVLGENSRRSLGELDKTEPDTWPVSKVLVGIWHNFEHPSSKLLHPGLSQHLGLPTTAAQYKIALIKLVFAELAWQSWCSLQDMPEAQEHPDLACHYLKAVKDQLDGSSRPNELHSDASAPEVVNVKLILDAFHAILDTWSQKRGASSSMMTAPAPKLHAANKELLDLLGCRCDEGDLQLQTGVEDIVLALYHGPLAVKLVAQHSSTVLAAEGYSSSMQHKFGRLVLERFYPKANSPGDVQAAVDVDMFRLWGARHGLYRELKVVQVNSKCSSL
eukprot:gene9442-9608_t